MNFGLRFLQRRTPSNWKIAFNIYRLRLLGGYDHLENLRLEDALQDLTGCVLDTTNFQEMTNANDLRRIEMFETLTQDLTEGNIVLLCSKVNPSITYSKMFRVI